MVVPDRFQPWNDSYYASADAFYNNGQTSGSLNGTPFVDPSVPVCGAAPTPVPSVPSTPVPSVPSTPVPSVPSTPVPSVPSTPVPSVPSTPSSSSVPPGAVPTTIGSVVLGSPGNAFHRWGPCLVRDYYHSNDGWVILVTRNSSAVVVRGRMLSGWIDNGGGPGRLGCPTGTEVDAATSRRTFSELQFFGRGYIYWATGMGHARASATTEFSSHRR